MTRVLLPSDGRLQLLSAPHAGALMLCAQAAVLPLAASLPSIAAVRALVSEHSAASARGAADADSVSPPAVPREPPGLPGASSGNELPGVGGDLVLPSPGAHVYIEDVLMHPSGGTTAAGRELPYAAPAEAVPGAAACDDLRSGLFSARHSTAGRPGPLEIQASLVWAVGVHVWCG